MAKSLIHICTAEGEKILYLYSSQSAPNTYLCVEDAEDYGEAKHQLLEGTEYEYRFEDENICFGEDSPLLKPSFDEKNRGRIVTGNYVGTLHLRIVNTNN